MNKIIVFPRISEFEKAVLLLDGLDLPYTAVLPPNEDISPAIVFEQDTYARLMASGTNEFIFSGCLDYRRTDIPEQPQAQAYTRDVLGNAYIMTAAPCVADDTKVRVVIHISGEIAPLFPYLNTEMRSAQYNPDGETLTFMEQHRLITLYNNKIAIAKADDIFDVWRLIEKIRHIMNITYQNRDKITPTYQAKKKPPAMDIFKRLPGISCGECGHKTCMSFALALWGGAAQPALCKPIFDGSYEHLQEGYIEICSPLFSDKAI